MVDTRGNIGKMLPAKDISLPTDESSANHAGRLQQDRMHAGAHAPAACHCGRLPSGLQVAYCPSRLCCLCLSPRDAVHARGAWPAVPRPRRGSERVYRDEENELAAA